MLPRMSTSLHIQPADYLPAWEAASLHQEIRQYQLPEAEIMVCPQALATASRFISSEKGMGGIYDHKGHYLDSSRHLRRRKDFTRANPVRMEAARNAPLLPGRYLYLGWFFNHYGHFMLESLSRCWPLTEKPRFDGYLYHFHARNPQPSARLFDFLDLLDIPREKLHFITRDIRVEELHIPTQQAVLSRAISPEMLHLYQLLGKRAWEREKPPVSPSKLYLSRRLLPPDMRHACNEYLLERHFHDQGYQIFHPQLHSPRAQLARFYPSTHLAGLEGSGLHHVLFARAPQETFLLATPQRRADAITQAQLDDYRDCHTHILFQKGSPSPKLQPERTSILLTAASFKQLGIPAEAPDPWSHVIWLQGLATQLKPHAGKLSQFAQQTRLSAQEHRLLSCLLHPSHAMDDDLLEQPSGKLAAALRHQAQGELAAASSLMASCREHCRDNPDFLISHARLLRQLKKPDEAARVLNQALVIDGENPELLHLQAELLSDRGQTEKAKTQLRRILSGTPLYRPSLISLATILAAESDFTAASTCLARAIEIFSGDGRLHTRLTWYLMQTGDWEKARENAEKALRLQPRNPHSHTHLARIWLELGKHEKAMWHIEEAIKRQPGNEAHYRLRARLHRELGNMQEALADEQQAKESRNLPAG
jgi:capsular polysaccharide biosynthesis protein